MAEEAKITITIDRSLLEHFAQNLARRESPQAPESAIALLLARILDGSAYPVGARKTGEREIRVFYRFRSFSQPLFWS